MVKNPYRVSCAVMLLLVCCSQGGKGSSDSSTPLTPAPLNLNGVWRFATTLTTSSCTPQPSAQETADMAVVHDVAAGTVRLVRSSPPDVLGVLSGGSVVFDTTVEVGGSTERTQMWVTFTVNSGTGVQQRDVTPAAPGVACTTLSDLVVTRLSGGTPSGQPVPGMVSIPAGTFWMGSEAGDPDEAPVHRVSISRTFWMGKYEVTQGEYQSVMGVNPTPTNHAQGSNVPVTRVSWEQAVVYCASITASERAAGRVPAGYEYRLPTEAEWEYCCRAGTSSEWSFGNSINCSQANYGGCANDFGEVGRFPANGFGLHDMHGNVSELCMDCWIRYPAGEQTDPFNNPYLFENRAQLIMVRGGVYGSSAANCRSASRSFTLRDADDYDRGFRIVLAPILVQ